MILNKDIIFSKKFNTPDTNHCITPEMRLTAMNEWVAFVAAGSLNDIQWRYDELNNEILQAVDRAKDPKNPQLIDAETA